ncbi:hypothetical protein KDM41_13175, partial [bacterium]|nr:hypothetical protein [bacterium]
VPVVSAVATDGGGWRLTWRTGLPGSTYRVRVLDAALREVTLLSAGSDTALAVAGDVLTGRPDTMFWQVDVLRDGDVVARSDLHPFSSR